MLLWVTFAVLSALAALAIVWPLARARRPVAPEGAVMVQSDVAVYRDQLGALDDEIARGLISDDEAAATRIEVSRRLLAAAERHERGAEAAGLKLSWGAIASSLVLAVTIGSLAIYLGFGQPDLPGQPLSARLKATPEEQSVDDLLARVESHLAENPEDGPGWDVVAPVYLRIGRFDDAARAFANAARLQGESGARLAGLGEALVQASDGVVTEAARDAFARAAALEPGVVRPRFFLALALEQDGKSDEAIAAWQALLAGSPSHAPWRSVVEQRLAALGAAPPVSVPGPNAAEIEAAQDMPAAERQEMVDQMVGRLATRLAEDGNDLDGWLRLARAYMVLGKAQDAKSALASARENFAGDAAALARIKAFATEAGLEG